MDPKSSRCMSENLEATDCVTDRTTDIRPRCNVSESSDLFEDDVDQFLFVDSRKNSGSLSSSIGSRHIQVLEKTLGLIDSILQLNNSETMSVDCCRPPEESDSSSGTGEKRPKSFLHDEMHEFNQIFSELVSTPQRKFPCRDHGFLFSGTQSSVPSKELSGKLSDRDTVSKSVVHTDTDVCITSPSIGVDSCESSDSLSIDNRGTRGRELSQTRDVILHGPDSTHVDCSNCPNKASCLLPVKADETSTDKHGQTNEEIQTTKHSKGDCGTSAISDINSASSEAQTKGLATPIDLKSVCLNCEHAKLYEPMNEEDADSGYQTGDSSVPAMVSAAKKLEGLASLSREDLLQRIEKFNTNKLGLVVSLRPDSNVYEGIIRVHLNIYRPIKMSLSSRPSSIYDILVRTDARLPEKESSVAFFRLPSNTFKAIHVTSETTTNVVIKTLLTKFNITDHPKRFELYERILPDEEESKKVLEDAPQLSNTLSFVRRLADDDRPLELCLRWADHGLDLLNRCQFVLQENDPGEIMWEEFSLPELNNFLRILSKEERVYADQIRTKYWLLKREIERRLQSLESKKKAS